MRVLTINIKDTYGGAGRAANRLHQALLIEGVESLMLVRDKESDDDNIFQTVNSKFSRTFSEIHPRIDRLPLRKYKNRKNVLFSTSLSSDNFIKKIDSFNPDVVHLHWINRGFLKLSLLPAIKYPMVISLHDMWTFTGGCHYDEDCGKYTAQCGNCPILSSGVERDLSYKLLQNKIRTYSKIPNLTIIGLSKWLADCANKSTALNNKHIVNLPNPIETDRFQPVDKKSARESLNIPLDKKLILFGAMDATDDTRKGYKYLANALKIVDKSDKELMIFGSSSGNAEQELGFKAHYMGNVTNDEELIKLYSAADVAIVPSIQENLSNIIMESLACGTPVVGFNIGGNSDMIQHEQNGYLAKALSHESMAEGINFVLQSEQRIETLSENARKYVVENFESKKVAQQYIELYKSIV